MDSAELLQVSVTRLARLALRQAGVPADDVPRVSRATLRSLLACSGSADDNALLRAANDASLSAAGGLLPPADERALLSRAHALRRSSSCAVPGGAVALCEAERVLQLLLLLRGDVGKPFAGDGAPYAGALAPPRLRRWDARFDAAAALAPPPKGAAARPAGLPARLFPAPQRLEEAPAPPAASHDASLLAELFRRRLEEAGEPSWGARAETTSALSFLPSNGDAQHTASPPRPATPPAAPPGRGVCLSRPPDAPPPLPPLPPPPCFGPESPSVGWPLCDWDAVGPSGANAVSPWGGVRGVSPSSSSLQTDSLLGAHFLAALTGCGASVALLSSPSLRGSARRAASCGVVAAGLRMRLDVFASARHAQPADQAAAAAIGARLRQHDAALAGVAAAAAARRAGEAGEDASPRAPRPPPPPPAPPSLLEVLCHTRAIRRELGWLGACLPTHTQDASSLSHRTHGCVLTSAHAAAFAADVAAAVEAPVLRRVFAAAAAPAATALWDLATGAVPPAVAASRLPRPLPPCLAAAHEFALDAAAHVAACDGGPHAGAVRAAASRLRAAWCPSQPQATARVLCLSSDTVGGDCALRLPSLPMPFLSAVDAALDAPLRAAAAAVASAAGAAALDCGLEAHLERIRSFVLLRRGDFAASLSSRLVARDSATARGDAHPLRSHEASAMLEEAMRDAEPRLEQRAHSPNPPHHPPDVGSSLFADVVAGAAGGCFGAPCSGLQTRWTPACRFPPLLRLRAAMPPSAPPLPSLLPSDVLARFADAGAAALRLRCFRAAACDARAAAHRLAGARRAQVAASDTPRSARSSGGGIVRGTGGGACRVGSLDGRSLCASAHVGLHLADAVLACARHDPPPVLSGAQACFVDAARAVAEEASLSARAASLARLHPTLRAAVFASLGTMLDFGRAVGAAEAAEETDAPRDVSSHEATDALAEGELFTRRVADAVVAGEALRRSVGALCDAAGAAAAAGDSSDPAAAAAQLAALLGWRSSPAEDAARDEH